MFQRYFDEGLAQSSYLLGCDRTREAVVIDPRRDIDAYVASARQLGLRLTCAIETHVHADFVSGARELGALGARTISGPGAGLEFGAHEAADGELLRVGDMSLRFLHSPGHTPEHISILAESPGEPTRLFTGDTLFVGAVGRPDLLGQEQTRLLAWQLYDSLFNTILPLGDDVEVHPGHGAGSLCGAGIGGDPHTTIGRERHFNPMLQHASREAFVDAVLADLPETPPYFARMKRLNKQGPIVRGPAGQRESVLAMTPAEAARAIGAGALLIDLRGADAFCEAHPQGAVNIGFGPKVGYWAGWVVAADARVILVASSPQEAEDAGRQLLRVGLDGPDGTFGYVEGGMDAWRAAALPTSAITRISVADLRERLTRRDALTVIDVRTPREWRHGHLDGTVHVPVGNVAAFATTWTSNEPIAAICEGGYRSCLAASLLARAGLTGIVNVTGGMAAYRAMETTT